MHALVSIPPSYLPQLKPSSLYPFLFATPYILTLPLVLVFYTLQTSCLSRPFLSPTPPSGHLSCRTNSAVIDSTFFALVIPSHFYLLNHLPGPHHLTSASFFLFSTPSSFSHYRTPLLSPAPILTIPQPSYLLQLTPFDTALRLHLT